jgi:hypothetical protein
MQPLPGPRGYFLSRILQPHARYPGLSNLQNRLDSRAILNRTLRRTMTRPRQAPNGTAACHREWSAETMTFNSRD